LLAVAAITLHYNGDGNSVGPYPVNFRGDG
jgi:hypothetical protein